MENQDIFQMSVDTDEDNFDDVTVDQTSKNYNQNATVTSQSQSAPSYIIKGAMNKMPAVTQNKINNEALLPIQELDDSSNQNLSVLIQEPSTKQPDNVYGIDDSIHQRIIGETVAKTMKQLMMEGRLMMENETVQQSGKNRFNKGAAANSKDDNSKTIRSMSELTIYDRAVQDGTQATILTDTNSRKPEKRASSSSEDGCIDTSDETILIPENVNLSPMPNMIHSNEVDRNFKIDVVAGGKRVMN